jgi:hypothetical protein
MRTWILASATAVVLAGLAGVVNAAEPWGPSQVRSSPARTPIFPAAHAWLNSFKQEAAPAPAAAAPAPAPAAPGPALRPAITGLNIGRGSSPATAENGYAEGATIAPTAWNHEHVYSGYIFGPGSCDHTAPCVDHLWDGYCQRPLRCGHGFHFHRHFFAGCGHHGGCGTCGAVSHDCGCHVGLFSGCHACRLHHLKHKLTSVFDVGCHSCGAAEVCGCGGPKLFGGLHRGWFAGLCNACDGGLSCSCTDSVPAGNIPGPPSPEPEAVPKPALSTPPEVPADDAKSARRTSRFVSGSLQ